MTLLITIPTAVRLAQIFGATVVAPVGGYFIGDAIINEVRQYLEGRAKAAWKYAYSQNTDPLPNDPVYDAFRHSYTSVTLTKFFGSEAAQLFMDANELVGGNEAPERLKDFFNNDKSVEIFGNGPRLVNFGDVDIILADGIKAAISTGALKTMAGDVPSGYAHDSYFPDPLSVAEGISKIANDMISDVAQLGNLVARNVSNAIIDTVDSMKLAMTNAGLTFAVDPIILDLN
ncbi:MAG: hypothetical protein ABL927_15145, partial [Bdellovibrionales bacterium]